MIISKKIKSSLILFIMFFCITALCSAREAVYKGTAYEINLSYNDTTVPGDIVFVRMKLTAAKGQKNPKSAKTDAKAVISDKKKQISRTEFFNISPAKKSHTMVELLAGLPLSTWVSAGTYSLTVTYTPFGAGTQEFSIPLTVTSKEFEKEEIPLSVKNTEIRTNTSPERIAQIDRLNTIFDTRNPNGVHSLECFTYPVVCERRTSGFADRRIYVYSTGKRATALHNGIDFGVPEGTEVCACSSGKVLLAENRISTGWSIVIEHLPGLYSIYYHLSEMSVKEGQNVKKGEKIGLSGATGMVTGPHLHWEIRMNSMAVNPDQLVKDFAFNPERKQTTKNQS